MATYIARCSGDPQCGVTAATPGDHDDHHDDDHDHRPARRRPQRPATTTTARRRAARSSRSGKQIFLVKADCGSCHTLKDAGSTGTVGPNLDQLKPPQDIVEHQVENGGGPMPAFKGTLTKAEITAVSTYVSSVAGK